MIGNSSKGFLSKLSRKGAKRQRRKEKKVNVLGGFAPLRLCVKLLVAAEFAEGGAEKSLERSR